MQRMRKAAGVIAAVFADSQLPLVVVGESAVAFYSQGRHPCRDLHFCRLRTDPIVVRARQRLMGMVDAVGGPSTWDVWGITVHLHGQVENHSTAVPFAIDTDYGSVDLVPPEQLLVEYLVVATFPVPNDHAASIVRLLLETGVLGGVEFDQEELQRLAELPEYDVAAALEAFSLELEKRNL